MDTPDEQQVPPRKRRPRRLPNEKYYTAAQAKQILGVKDSTLYNFVDSGQISRVLPPGRKHGLYIKAEIDQLARDIAIFYATRKKTKSTFQRATPEDIPTCVDISNAILTGGGYVHFTLASAETRISWMSRNPDLFYVVKDQGQIMGYTGLIPMAHELLLKVLKNDVLMKDITPDQILPYIPGDPLDVYIMTMVVRPDPNLTLSERRAYGFRLIAGVLSTLMYLGSKGVVLHSLYARSNTPDGIRLLKGMGFTQIETMTDMQNFVIRVEESGLRFIIEYKDALKHFLDTGT